MPPNVSVIIPNWNGCQLLRRCISALIAQTFSDFEIIVVDNGSQDGSVQWLETQASHVHVIRNSTNLGFAVANNQGIRASSASLIATLNNDAVPAPDWLEALAQAADRAGRVGMFASKILLCEPEGHMDSAGMEVDRAGVAWNRRWRLRDPGQETEYAEVFCPSAAAALYRREMLNQIGLFDEDLFAYYEDVDLAWRARWAGWACLYVPQAVVRHAHSATLGRGAPLKIRLLSRNKWWTIVKNYPFRAMARYIPIMILFDVGAMLAAALTGRTLSPMCGRWAALCSLRKMWQKRREVQRHARGAIDWHATLVPVRLPIRSPRGLSR